MITSLYFIESDSYSPYENLALEAYLLEHVQEGECILYLWQNENTVVVGRNQNAHNECKIEELLAEGGHIVRRLSGGGAVYHDIGNLNFTFLMPNDDYDMEKQTEVILRAVKKLSIKAERNGRNDLTIDGKKFSGHAYYHTKKNSYHHGTIMVNVNQEKLAKYLKVSMLKLQDKGVKSVQSRVTNLTEFNSNLRIPLLKETLCEAFSEVYQKEIVQLKVKELNQKELKSLVDMFSSEEWIYGKKEQFEYCKEARFPWGTIRIEYSLKNEIIEKCAVWTDGLQADFLSRVPDWLKGAKYDRDMLLGACRKKSECQTEEEESMVNDIISCLMS